MKLSNNVTPHPWPDCPVCHGEGMVADDPDNSTFRYGTTDPASRHPHVAPELCLTCIAHFKAIDEAVLKTIKDLDGDLECGHHSANWEVDDKYGSGHCKVCAEIKKIRTADMNMMALKAGWLRTQGKTLFADNDERMGIMDAVAFELDELATSMLCELEEGEPRATK